MTRSIKALSLCAVLLPVTPGVSTAQDAPKDIVLTEKDNGKSITLSGKQRLVIKLPIVAGTAYGWSALMTSDAILAFTDNPPDTEPVTTGTPMVGGPSQTVLSFRPVRYTETYGAGFTLIYCSTPCSPRDRATKTFRIGVTTKK